MLFTQALILATTFVHQLHASPLTSLQQYIQPSSGTASTTAFYVGSEFGGGTACGVTGLPGGQQAGSSPGGGPGYLYAALNQLGFGAGNGPGPVCGLCYALTPVSSSGQTLDAQTATFMIIDSCPVNSQQQNCGQCNAGSQNGYGKTYLFDIAVDAMSKDQYDTFFNGVTDVSNWDTVNFVQASCDESGANPRPDQLKDWGCVQDCQSKDSSQFC